MKLTLVLQEEAANSLAAAKELYEQLAEEREQADHDLQAARQWSHHWVRRRSSHR